METGNLRYTPHRDFCVMLVGGAGVGKTSLMHAASGVPRPIEHTSGVDIVSVPVTVQHTPVRLQVWTAQNPGKSLNPALIRRAHGLLAVYDVTDRDSYRTVTRWLGEVRLNGGRPLGLVLLGNKADLEEQRMVTSAEGKALADSLGVPFFETSLLREGSQLPAFQAMAAELLGLH